MSKKTAKSSHYTEAIRLKRDEDDGFIASCWLKSAMYPTLKEWPFFKDGKKVYREQFSKIIKHALDSKVFLVACSAEEPDNMYGFVCFEPSDPPLIHFVYVKELYRRGGVASALVSAVTKGERFAISSASPVLEKICRKHPEMITHFDRFSLFGIEPYRGAP